jgi:hypothetical protein
MIQEALAMQAKRTKSCPQQLVRQASGFQGITPGFLFGLPGASIIFACRVKKTGQNF